MTPKQFTISMIINVVFVFWFLENTNTCQLIQTINPVKNVMWVIFWFVYQPIFTNFNSHLLQSSRRYVIYSAAFHPHMPLLVAGLAKGNTVVFDLSTSPPNIKHCVQHHTNTVYSVAFHSTLSLCATGSADNSVILYESESATMPLCIKHHLKDHCRWVCCVAFHPKLPFLATGSNDNSTILYNLSNIPPSIQYHLKHHIDWVCCVHFHYNLPLFATCSIDATTIMYNFSSSLSTTTTKFPPILQHHLDDHTCCVLCVVFHPNLPLFATGSSDNCTILYDITTLPPTIQYRLTHHTAGIVSIAFHSNLFMFASYSGDNSIILYDIQTSPPTVKFYLQFKKYFYGRTRFVHFHPNLPLFIISTKRQNVILYNLNKM